MSKDVVSYIQQQAEVNTYFRSKSSYWNDIYASSGVQAQIYRDRQAAALAWIDEFALAPGSRVLEIGCGAGFLTVALAQRGLRVQAIDSAEDMVELTRRHVAAHGAGELLSVEVGDVYALACEDDSFDIVVALGVIPWLAQPELALREIARVSRPDGHVLLTADNRARLSNLLDPWLNPALVPLRRWVGAALKRTGLLRRSPEGTSATHHTRHFINTSLMRTGLIKIRDMTLGFGPFTVSRREFLSEPRGMALYHRLQHLADRGIPLLRSTGSHYIVLARKSAAGRSPERSTGAGQPALNNVTTL